MSEKRAPAKSFQDLIVWQKAHALVLQVYAATRAFRKEELYGLASQCRLAAVSIPANIVSEGSLEECRYCLILAHDLGCMDKQAIWPLSDEVGRLLNAYRTAILTPNSQLPTPNSQLPTPNS
jgi:hypothetical protein